jgi:hypothetical protein
MDGAALYSGMSRRLIENAVRSGILRSSMPRISEEKKRGLRLIDLQSLDAWIESGVGNVAAVPYLVRTDREPPAAE